MSEHYPPPGWQSSPQDPYGARDRPVPPAPASYPAPPRLAAAHKPGAIPLRPLALGDIYDAAFKIIRFNPKATVGSAVLVAAVAMAIPVLGTAALGSAMEVSLPDQFTGSTSGNSGRPLAWSDVEGFVAVMGTLVVGSIFQGIGLILVGGMMAHVVAAAAVGRKLSLGEAWSATRGKRWRLIAVTLLLGVAATLIMVVYALSWVAVAFASNSWQVPLIYGLISVPAFIAVLFAFWVRVYYLPVPVLMLEDVGVFGALGRGFHLTRGAFWRTFGIALLTLVIAQIAGSMLSAPVSIVSQGVLVSGLSGEGSVFVLILGQALATVIAAAFVAPFTTAVATLQYVDLRMRKEAFDVELMQRAGITRS